jgi:4-aminobutyrate aminotransferase
LQRVLRLETTPRDTAAILVEPVLGEGGYVVPPKGFLHALRRLCDEHEILLIADEVQTGFGRTGRFFAVDHSAVRPDVLVMAKAIASGLPLGAIATSEALADRWPSGAHGSTFGGNVVACAAALATLNVIRDENLVDNASLMGALLLDGLRALQRRSPVIGDVRGLGLMVGVELQARGTSSASRLAKEVQRRCREEGLLLLTCGPNDQVIRWIPPLIVQPEQIAIGLSIFEWAVEHAEQTL